MGLAAPAVSNGNFEPRRSGGGGLLSPAFIDELRNRTTLSALIGRSVKLQKAGREFKACCPFHNEKSPSFYVNDEKGFYHCFGCGVHGDAIRFLTEAKGLPFMDAVRELAQSAGMELPAPDPAARARAERATGLVGVSEAAAKWYQKQLSGIEGTAARAYLDGRGIGNHARETFGMGFAPDGRNRLAPALEGTQETELVEAGLLIKPEDGSKAYDRFRGRLMIPIRDARGRTIAFGGRIIDQGEPKYLNSPDTPLFDKGQTLFNLDRAGPLARKTGRVIVVEGYMDVIALDQAGISEAVAPLGTALTEPQLARLWTLVDAPILCFDGDAAGRKAGIRAARRALPLLRPGKTLRFAMLPVGQDPDDLIRAGGSEAFEAAIAQTVTMDELLYREEREAANTSIPEGRAGLRQQLYDLASEASDKLMAEEYRRTFMAHFFEDFGWKKNERREIASAFLRTGARISTASQLVKCTRMMLWGFSKWPALIAGRLEELAGLRIDDKDLDRWRQVIVEAIIDRRALDDDAMASILEAAPLPEVLAFRLQSDLLFPFVKAEVGSKRASDQIVGLLDTLFVEAELKDRLNILDAQVQKAFADKQHERYGEIEAERADVRGQHVELLEAAFRLGERDEG